MNIIILCFICGALKTINPDVQGSGTAGNFEMSVTPNHIHFDGERP